MELAIALRMGVSEVSLGCRLVRNCVAPAHVEEYKELKPRGADLGRNIYHRNDVKPLPEYAYLGFGLCVGGIYIDCR